MNFEDDFNDEPIEDHSGLRLAANVFTTVGIFFLMPFVLIILEEFIHAPKEFGLLIIFWSMGAFALTAAYMPVAAVVFSLPFLLFVIYVKKTDYTTLDMWIKIIIYAICTAAYIYCMKVGYLPT